MPPAQQQRSQLPFPPPPLPLLLHIPPIANTIIVGPRHFPVSLYKLALTSKSYTILTISPVAKVTPTPGTAPTAPPSSRRSPTVCLSAPYLSRSFTDSPRRRYHRRSHQHHRPQEVDGESSSRAARSGHGSQFAEGNSHSIVVGRLRTCSDNGTGFPDTKRKFISWYIAFN